MASDDLEEKIKEKLKDITDSGQRKYGAAVVILRHYLGEPFIAECVRLSTKPDPFMLNEFDENSDNRFIHMQRVVALADYLFALRETDGFDVLLERLTRRPIRAPYLEARIASYFKESGFKVKIKEERKIKREDFDFEAARHSEKINVEVTSCTNDEFTRNNLWNVLQKKRQQLPDNAPAALYCVLPLKWFGASDLHFHLFHITNEFFISTKRINYVCYVWDPITILPQGGAALAETNYSVYNQSARIKIGDLSFLNHEPDHVGEARAALRKGRLESLSKMSFPEPSFTVLASN